MLSSVPLGYSFEVVADALRDDTIQSATIVTHGFQLSADGGDSLSELADAISTRVSQAYPGDPVWFLDYDIPAAGEPGAFDAAKTTLPSGTAESGHVVLLFDWAPESNEASAGWGEAAGEALFTMLVGLGIAELTPQPTDPNPTLHFIAHSFGSAVTSEAVERLARFDVPVDQVTYLDPHDFNQGIWFDGKQELFTLGLPANYGATVWDNVAFSDVYYQTKFFPDGRPIPGAFNTFVNDDVPWLTSHSSAWNEYYIESVRDVTSTTGYAYSSVARDQAGSAAIERPNGNFFEGQHHQHSEDILNNSTPTEARLNTSASSDQLSQEDLVTGKWKPLWQPTTIANGTLSDGGDEHDAIPVDSNLVPGWSHHGGGGPAKTVVMPDGHFGIELTGSTPWRQHNRFFLADSVDSIGFDVNVPVASDSTRLLVRLETADGNEVPPEQHEWTYDLDAVTVGSEGALKRVISIPAAHQNRVNVLRFELISELGPIDARVQLHEVRLAPQTTIISGDFEIDGTVLLEYAGNVVFDATSVVTGKVDEIPDDLILDVDGSVTFLGKVVGLRDVIVEASERIIVGSDEGDADVIISTRQITRGGDEKTAISLSDSGDIRFRSKEILLYPGASLLAHVDEGSDHQPGTIVVQAEAGADLADAWYAPVDVSENFAKVTLEDALIWGGDIRIAADAVDRQIDGDMGSYSEKAMEGVHDVLSQLPGIFLSSITGISGQYIRHQAAADVTLTGSTVKGSGSVRIESNADTDASLHTVSVNGNATFGYFTLAIGYGEADSSAETTIDGTQIDAQGTVEIKSNATTNAFVKARTNKRTLTLNNPDNLSFAIAVAKTNETSKVWITDQSAVTSGNANVNVEAFGDVNNFAWSEPEVDKNGILAIGLSHNMDTAEIEARVDGSIDAGGTGPTFDPQSDVDYDDNIIHIPEHGFFDGQMVWYSHGRSTLDADGQSQSIGGLQSVSEDSDVYYHVQVVDQDHIRLAAAPTIGLETRSIRPDTRSEHRFDRIAILGFESVDVNPADGLETITFSQLHGLQNGQAVTYLGAASNVDEFGVEQNAGVGGLEQGTTYFVVPVENDGYSIRLAESPGGPAIDLLDAGIGSHAFRYEDKTTTFSPQTAVDEDTNTITFVGPHGLSTGDAVFYHTDPSIVEERGFPPISFDEGLNVVAPTTLTLVGDQSHLIAEDTDVWLHLDIAAKTAKVQSVSFDAQNDLTTVVLDSAALTGTLTRVTFASMQKFDQPDSPIDGLRNGAIYFVVKVDDQSIRLTSSKAASDLAVPIDLSMPAVDSGDSHSLRSSQSEDGILVNAVLEAANSVNASAEIDSTSVPRTVEFLGGGDRTFLEAERIPGVARELIHWVLGKQPVESPVFPGAEFGAAGTVAINHANHDVAAIIGPTAQLASSESISVAAEILQKSQVASVAGVGKPKDSQASVAEAVGFGILNNTALATIEEGAKLDAHEKISVDSDVTYPFLINDPFAPINPLAYLKQTGIEGWAYFMDGTLGYASNLFNTFVMTTASESDVGAGGSIMTNQYTNTSKAKIQNGARINQQDLARFRDGSQTVDVIADIEMNLIHVVGVGGLSLNLEGGYNAIRSAFGKPDGILDGVRQLVNPFGAEGDKAGIGVSYLAESLDNSVEATIATAAIAHAGSGGLAVKADTDIFDVAIAQAGSKAGSFAVSGAFAISVIDNNTKAHVDSGAVIDCDGSMSASALDDLTRIGITGGLAAGSNLGEGVSVSFNHVDRNTLAFIGTEIGDASTATDTDITANGPITVDAKSTGSLWSASVAAAIAGLAPPENGVVNEDRLSAVPTMVSTPLGAPTPAQPKIGVGVAGDASFNVVAESTRAFVNDSGSITTGDQIVVSSETGSTLWSLAGSVALAIKGQKSSFGIAGSISANVVETDTKSFIAGAIIDAQSLDVIAVRTGGIRSLTAAGSGAPLKDGIAFAGSVSVNVVDDTVDAYVQAATATLVSNASILAANECQIWAIGGAAAWGGKVGVGVGFALNVMGSQSSPNVTQAYIDGSSITVTNGSLKVYAANENMASESRIIAISGSLGVGTGPSSFAGAGTIAINHIFNDTKASIVGSTLIARDDTSIDDRNIEVQAEDRSKILSDAGGFSVALVNGKGLSLGAAVAINEIRNQTLVYADDSDCSADGEVVFVANSDATIEGLTLAGAVAAAGSGGSGAVGSIGAAVSANKISNTIEAYAVGDTMIQATGGDVFISATDNSEINVDAGGFAFAFGTAKSSAGTLAVGASWAHNEISNQVRAYIAQLAGRQQSPVILAAGEVEVLAVSAAEVKAVTVGVAVSGVGSTSGLGLAGSGAGALAENQIANVVEATMTTAGRFETLAGNLKLIALDESYIIAQGFGGAIAVGASATSVGASAAVGLSIARNEIANQVRAAIDQTELANPADVTALPFGGLEVSAKSLSNIVSESLAASLAVGAAKNVGVAWSGGGAESTNSITTDTLAYLRDVTLVSDSAVTLDTANLSNIRADVVALAGALGLSGGTLGGAVAIGGSAARNYIGYTLDGSSPDEGQPRSGVRASIENSDITVTSGDFAITAKATPTINSAVASAAAAVAGSLQLGAISFSGSGSDSENRISMIVDAAIDHGSVVNASQIFVEAHDTSTVNAYVDAVALAISLAPRGSLAQSFGGSFATNVISNEVQASIQDGSDALARNGNVELLAKEDATIDAFSTAAAASLAIAQGALSISGAGAKATNLIGNQVHALVDSSSITTRILEDTILDSATQVSGDVKVEAFNDADISASVAAVAASAAVGGIAVAGSVGVTSAENLIPDEDFIINQYLTIRPNEVLAYFNGSTLTAAGDVLVSATSTESVNSNSLAGSIAVATAGNATSGAGTWTTNHLATRVHAFLSDTHADVSGDIRVVANSISLVTKASAIGTAIGYSLAGPTFAVAASSVKNEIRDDVQAYVSETATESGRYVKADGNISISADVKNASVNDISAATASISKGGFSVSGGGVDIDNLIKNHVVAHVTGDVELVADNEVIVGANENASLAADATTVTVAASLGAALGAAQVRNAIASEILATVTDAHILSADTAIIAESDSNIEKTVSAGISASSLAGQGNRADAVITTFVDATTANATLISSGDVNIVARAVNSAGADAFGGAFGALAAGAMIADVSLGQIDTDGNTVATHNVRAFAGDNTTIEARKLRTAASSTDNLLAGSVAAAGGVVAGAGASAGVTSRSDVLAGLGVGSCITVDTLEVNSIHDQSFDARADAFTLALATGSGAAVENSIVNNVNVEIGAGTEDSAGVKVDARNILVRAVNLTDKDHFRLGGNLQSGSVSAAGSNLLSSYTELSNEAVVTVGRGSSLKVDGNNSAPGIFEIEAFNGVTAVDRVRIETVSGYNAAVGKSEVNADTTAAINVVGATLESTAGDIFLTATSDASVHASANLLVASTVTGTAGAEGTANSDVQNEVNLDGATITGRDIHLYTGRDGEGRSNLITANANTELTTISMLPSITIPVPTANINEFNRVKVTGSSTIHALEDVELISDGGFGGTDRRNADGVALSLSLIPYGFPIPSHGSDVNTNTIEIGDQASVEAGVSNYAEMLIKSAFKESLDPSRLGQNLTAEELQHEGVSYSDVEYVYQALDAEQIAFGVADGTVVEIVDEPSGSFAGTGVIGGLYRYKTEFEGSVRIVLHEEDYEDSDRWERLYVEYEPSNYPETPVSLDNGQLVRTEDNALFRFVGNDNTEVDLDTETFEDPARWTQIVPVIYRSDLASNYRDILKDQFYVVRPANLESPKLSLQNIGGLLIARRSRILDWIANHSSNHEAIARYQIQLELVNRTLQELGLLEDLDTNDPEEQIHVVKEGLDVLFVDVPDLYAAPGSIFIEADGASVNNFNRLLDDQLVANQGAGINVSNQTPFSMTLADAMIRDNRRAMVLDGTYQVFSPGKVYFNGQPLTETEDVMQAEIKVTQTATSHDCSEFGLEEDDCILEEVSRDVYVLGEVVNEVGNVSITNSNGSINVDKEIRGENVEIGAKLDFNLNADDWFHNRDPRQSTNFDAYRGQVFNASGDEETRIFSDSPSFELSQLSKTLTNPDPDATPVERVEFGSSLAISEEYVVVGVPKSDLGATDAGAVYIFSAENGELLDTLENPMPISNDHFGFSVAVSGDTVVVGVPDADDGATDSGVVYFYSAATGEQLRRIVNPSPAREDRFGFSVGVSGDTVVVGSPWADDAAKDAGIAYIYSASDIGNFQVINQPNPEDWDVFGYDVAVSGNTVVVGVPYENYQATDDGAAVVFSGDNGSFNFARTLLNPSPSNDERFGFSVDVSGDTIVVGVPRADFAGHDNSGAAYVFSASSGTRLQTLIQPSGSNEDNDFFGSDVAISGDRIVIGAVGENYESSGDIDAGAAFIYSAISGDHQQTLFNPTPDDNDFFGRKVAVSADLVLIGALGEDVEGAIDAGAVYVYSDGIAGLDLRQTLYTPLVNTIDQFGDALAMSEDYLLVGVPFDDTSGDDSGVAYLYSVATGELLHTFENPAPATDDRFGYSVAVSDEYVVVGSPWADIGRFSSAGVVYVFSAVTGERLHTLKQPNPENGDVFGFDVAISDDTIVVGTPYENYNGKTDTGAVLLYSASSGEHKRTILNPTSDDNDYFGYSVAVSGDHVVVGTRGANFSNLTDAGAVYIFSAATGARTMTLTQPTDSSYDYFGTDVAILGDRLAVGAPGKDKAGIADAGAVFVYSATSGDWQMTLENPTPRAHDSFGNAVALSEQMIAVGAVDADVGAFDSGAAFLFTADTGDLMRRAAHPQPSEEDHFGSVVALWGDTLTVGAPGDDAAYVFMGVEQVEAGTIVAQGRVAITARLLDINGPIQSGIENVTLHIGPEFSAETAISLLDRDGNPIQGVSFGEDGVPVNASVRVEGKEKRIIVGDIVPAGGEILLAGQILSTGNGQLLVAHGYANVDIDNQSDYELILNRIDTTKKREGKITIVDTARLQRTEYVIDESGGQKEIRETVYQGEPKTDENQNVRIEYEEVASFNHSLDASLGYQPRAGLQYVWTEGQEKSTTIRKTYEDRSFNLLGFDWDALVSDKFLKSTETFYRDQYPLLESEILATPFNYALEPLSEKFSDGDVSSWSDPSNPYSDRWKIVDQVTGQSSKWRVTGGKLSQSSNLYGTTTTNTSEGRLGTYVFYDEVDAFQWQDYQLNVDVRTSDNDGIGVLFRYQDPDNFYKFEMDAERKFSKLFKLQDGIEKTIEPVTSSDWVSYPVNTDFRITVNVTENETVVMIDGNEVRRYRDSNSPLTRGTVALYCWGQEGIQFDNVSVALNSAIVAQLTPGFSVKTLDGNLYRYHGPVESNIDLAKEDFGDFSRWTSEVEPPDYSTDQAYTIQYVRLDDTDVELIPNATVVKVIDGANEGGIADHKYLYVGDPDEVVLSEQDYSDTDKWEDVTEDPAYANVDFYESNFVNTAHWEERTVTGGGWLRYKTVRTITTDIFGEKDYYTHTLAADHPIAISFLDGPETPSIDISSAKDISFRRTVTSPPVGTVTLTSESGDMIFSDSSAVLGVMPTISVGGSLRVNVEGTAPPALTLFTANAPAPLAMRPLTLTAKDDIDIRVVYDPMVSGNTILVGQILSTEGDVILHAPDGIYAFEPTSIVSGNRIELHAGAGGIGHEGQPLRIDSDFLDGGFAAKGVGDIFVQEISGSLRLLEPQSWRDVSTSVTSEFGNVELHVDSGSILDAIYEEFEPRTQEEIEASNLSMQLSGQQAQQAAETAIRSDETRRTQLYHEYWRQYRKAAPNAALQETVVNSIDDSANQIRAQLDEEIQTGTELFFRFGLDLTNQEYADSEQWQLKTILDQVSLPPGEPVNIGSGQIIRTIDNLLYRFRGSTPEDVQLGKEDFDDFLRWVEVTPEYDLQADWEVATVAGLVDLKVGLQVKTLAGKLYRYQGDLKENVDPNSIDFTDIEDWFEITAAAGDPVPINTGMLIAAADGTIYEYLGGDTPILNLHEGLAYYAVVTGDPTSKGTTFQLTTSPHDALLAEQGINEKLVDFTLISGNDLRQIRVIEFRYEFLPSDAPELGEVPDNLQSIHKTYGGDDHYDPGFVFQLEMDERAQWLDDRTFELNSLSSPAGRSLFEFLSPSSLSTGGSSVVDEQTNIFGKTVTLVLSSGSVGQVEPEMEIDLANGFDALNESERQAIAAASIEDVIAVGYQVYRYLGPDHEVNLANANFEDAALWELQIPDFPSTQDEPAALITGDLVQVTTPQDENGVRQFGVYRYVGLDNPSVDLGLQDYLDTNQWQPLAELDATQGTQQLATGAFVGRLESLRLEVWNDIDIHSENGLNIDATGFVAVGSPADLSVRSINTTGAIRLTSHGDILQNAAGGSSITSIGGQVTLYAGGDVLIDAASQIFAGDSLTIAGGRDSADHQEGTTIEIYGKTEANSAKLLGSMHDDSFSIENLSMFLIDAGEGFDAIHCFGAEPVTFSAETAAHFAGVESFVLDAIVGTQLQFVDEALHTIAGSGVFRLVHGQLDGVTYVGDWSVDSPKFDDGTFLHILTSGDSTLEIVNTRPWRNPLNPYDVGHDGMVSPLDALRILNRIATDGYEQKPPNQNDNPFGYYFDVNGDNWITLLDALNVINRIAVLSYSSVQAESASFVRPEVMVFGRFTSASDDEPTVLLVEEYPTISAPRPSSSTPGTDWSSAPPPNVSIPSLQEIRQDSVDEFFQSFEEMELSDSNWHETIRSR